MRKVFEEQRVLGSPYIANISINFRCRDEMPRLLLGLQHIYCTPELREEVFKILESMLPSTTDKDNGRPGMVLWKILVFGCVRLGLNCDYDRLHDLANNHNTFRQMLGHGIVDENHTYALQTIKDNASLFSPKIFERLNEVVVKSGHRLIYGKKKTKKSN